MAWGGKRTSTGRKRKFLLVKLRPENGFIGEGGGKVKKRKEKKWGNEPKKKKKCHLNWGFFLGKKHCKKQSGGVSLNKEKGDTSELDQKPATKKNGSLHPKGAHQGRV